MKKFKIIAALACAGALALGLVGCGGGSTSSSSASSSSAAETSTNGSEERLVFVTGGESGTYYAYGSVLGQYATNGDFGLDVTVLSSEGSKANVQAIEDGDANLAFCQSDVMDYAYNGTNIFEGAAFTGFSTVADLYQEQVQIVTCDETIKTVADLAGKTVSVGAANSGVYFNALDVLSVYDLGLEDIDPVYQSFQDSADSLKDGKIDAAFIVAGAPTTAITDLSTTKAAYLVSMDQAHVDQLCEMSPFYTPATIAADTYGTEGPVTTVSVGAVIIVSNDVPDEAVYEFTKSLFEGKENNTAAHAKYAELNLEEATSVVTVPYHPGAAQYYEEQGITVVAE